jgi:hypothetical protein
MRTSTHSVREYLTADSRRRFAAKHWIGSGSGQSVSYFPVMRLKRRRIRPGWLVPMARACKPVCMDRSAHWKYETLLAPSPSVMAIRFAVERRRFFCIAITVPGRSIWVFVEYGSRPSAINQSGAESPLRRMPTIAHAWRRSSFFAQISASPSRSPSRSGALCGPVLARSL